MSNRTPKYEWKSMEGDLWREHGEAADKKAFRQRIVLFYLPFVYDMAVDLYKKLPTSIQSSISINDLVGEGVIGILGCIDTYEPGRYMFTTYSRSRIFGCMVDGLRSWSFTPNALLRRGGILNCTSLHSTVTNSCGRQTELGKTLESKDPPPEKAVDDDDEVNNLLSGLNSLQRTMLFMDEGRGFKQTEIAATMGVTKQYVNQIVASARAYIDWKLSQKENSCQTRTRQSHERERRKSRVP